MVTNRVMASRSIKFKRTKNKTTDDVSRPMFNAKIVSMAPELSLSAIGTEIPVIEMPPGMPYPKLIETANIMTLIGQMAMHRPIPRERIKQLGDNTSKIPSIYNRGLSALGFCQSIMNRWWIQVPSHMSASAVREWTVTTMSTNCWARFTDGEEVRRPVIGMCGHVLELTIINWHRLIETD